MNNTATPSISDHARTLARRSGWLVSAQVFRLATQLAVLILFARELTVEDYGKYQSAWLYTNLLGVIMLFGLPSVILTFPTFQLNNWIRKNRQLFTFLLVAMHLLVGTWIYAFSTLSGYEKPVIFVYIVITNISVIFETLMVKQGRERQLALLNVLYALLFLALHIYHVANSYSFLLLFGSLAALQILKCFATLPKRDRNAASGNETLVSRQWLYLGFYDVIGVIFRWLDKWIILFYAGLAPFAIYFNGAYEIPVFALMVSAVSSIMITELSSDNGKSVKAQFHNSSKLLASFVFPAFAFLLFYHQEFFILMFGTKYLQSIPVFLVCIFVLPVRITGYTSALQVLGRNELVLRGALYDLVLAILLVLVLYPFFGVRGLAAAFVISTWIQAAYYSWHTAHLSSLKISTLFPFVRLAWMMGLALLVSALTYWFAMDLEWNLWIGAATAGTLSLIFFWMYKSGRGFG